IEAAHTIGLKQAVLLEEPQAAFYSWIEKSQGGWRDQVSVGDIILVVDIGGGTTDLSLIAVTDNDGNLELTRIAVGDHILLGGDNMDLALAYTVKAKLEKEGDRLAPWQVQALSHSCREAKENLFSNPDVNEVPIVVSNRGSSLIGGALRTVLTREELNQVLIEGFLPQVVVSETPMARPKGGLRTTGLPYAQDAGITRHLAAFLRKQQNATADLAGFNLSKDNSFLHPTAVLFNGGVLKADVLIERMMTVINSWLTTEQSPEARILTDIELDAGVARGAAFFGYMRQHNGIRIRGGTAASFYVGVESAMPAVPGMPPEIEALCIAPFGMEEGTEEIVPEDEFGLVVGEPVRFRFYSSNSRRDDNVGTRLDFWSEEELEELYEIEVTLSAEKHQVGDVIPVHLCAAVTDVGTLELLAISSTDKNDRWKIEFDVRNDDD
ncbi:MAG: Hsp70 family protein, partial [Methylococcales bacterium]|nr:Hsp70 family protein [Methylococcales bacterium]